MNKIIRWALVLWLLVVWTPLSLIPASAMVNEVTAANRYIGNGSTTAFAYTFKALVKTDVEVLVNDTVKLVDTDYTVAGLGASGGGTVTFTTAPASAAKVTILRKQPVQQLSDYVPNEAMPAERIEKDLDKLAMIAQQQKEVLDRTPKLPKKSTLSGITFPEPGADKYIKWNSTGTDLEAASAGGSGGGGLPSNPVPCPSGQYVIDQNEVGTLTCAQPSFSELSGTVTDAQVPNNITVDLATSATTAVALAANGTNCTGGEAAAGVDASGNAEGCFAPSVTNHNVLSATHPDSLAASPVLGDLIHGNATPAWARVAGNITTTKKFLNQTGTGSVSAVPSWDALVDADIPNTITIDLAATATALAANGANCSSGNAPLGVDASGAAEGCFSVVPSTRTVSTSSPLGGGGALSSDLTLTCANCTTNAAALTADQVVVGNGTQTAKTLAAGTAGFVLTMSGGIPAWSSPGAPAGHAILSASHSDTVADTVVLGDVVYGNATPAWQRLAGNTTTTKKFMRQTGTGTVSAVPAWDTIVAGDLPAGFVDATTDLAAGLCTDGQIFKKAAGVWTCAADTTGSGITTLNGLTTDPQTLAVGAAGTDVAWSSVTSTHTLNVPSASQINRGVVTTGTQTFGGVKTMPGAVLNGSQAIGLDASGGTFSDTGIVLKNTGSGIKALRAGNLAETGFGLAGTYQSTAILTKVTSTSDTGAALFVGIKNDSTGTGAFPIALHAYGRTTFANAYAHGIFSLMDAVHRQSVVVGIESTPTNLSGFDAFSDLPNDIGGQTISNNAPYLSAYHATCRGPNKCSTVLYAAQDTPGGAAFQHGMYFAASSIIGSTFADISSSTNSLDIKGSHTNAMSLNTVATNGINFQSGTYTNGLNFGAGTYSWGINFAGGSYNYGVDLSNGTFVNMAIKAGNGTSGSRFTNRPARGIELAYGTVASPISVTGPTMKLSRIENLSASACTSNLDTECNATLALYYKSTTSGGTAAPLGQALYVSSIGEGSAGSAGDAIAGAFQGMVINTGNKVGQGIYAEGRRNTTTAKAMGAEIRVVNGTKDTTHTCVNDTSAAGLFSDCVALLLSGASFDSDTVTSNTTNLNNAIQVSPLYGAKFNYGLVFNQSSVAIASLEDESSSTYSYRIGGPHSIGIYLSGSPITTGIFFGSGSYATGIDFGTATYSNATMQFGASFQGGGNRALCVSNRGGLYRGADGVCGGLDTVAGLVVNGNQATGIDFSGGTFTDAIKFNGSTFSEAAILAASINDPKPIIYIDNNRTSTSASADQVPIKVFTRNKCAGCIGRAYYAEGRLESGSTSTSTILNFESSPVNTLADRGFGYGASTVDANHNVTAWDVSSITSAFRASAGNNIAYGCTSGSTCFPATFAYEVIPNGTRFHTGFITQKDSVVDRAFVDNSDATISIEVRGTHTNVLNMASATTSSAPIVFPSNYTGGGDRVLCVNNTGQIYRGATSSSC